MPSRKTGIVYSRFAKRPGVTFRHDDLPEPFREYEHRKLKGNGKSWQSYPKKHQYVAKLLCIIATRGLYRAK